VVPQQAEGQKVRHRFCIKAAGERIVTHVPEQGQRQVPNNIVLYVGPRKYLWLSIQFEFIRGPSHGTMIQVQHEPVKSANPI
jgi:hypothetical protein